MCGGESSRRQTFPPRTVRDKTSNKGRRHTRKREKSPSTKKKEKKGKTVLLARERGACIHPIYSICARIHMYVLKERVRGESLESFGLRGKQKVPWENLELRLSSFSSLSFLRREGLTKGLLARRYLSNPRGLS